MDNSPKAVRKHPVTAWVLIVFFVLTLALTFISQLVQLLKTLGVLDAKP